MKRLIGSRRKRSQRFFRHLLYLAVDGMNYGHWDITEDGEIPVMDYAFRKARGSGDEKLVIFDVGANHGAYSLTLAGRMPANTIVKAFEPVPATFAVLTEALKGKANFEPVNIGFSNTDTELEMFVYDRSSEIASLHAPLTGTQADGQKKVKVTVRRLDSFCKEHKIPHIHLLKLDVEGHEYKVLQGAECMLSAGAIDFIMFEFNINNIMSRTFFRDYYEMLNKDYQLYRVVSDGLVPIDWYGPEHEIFMGSVYYLAERRKLVAK